MNASDAKYFDGADGFLVLGTSATGGSQIMRMTSFSFSFSVDTQETLSFDDNKNKGFAPSFSTFELSAEAYFTAVSGDSTSPSSGSSYVTGGLSGSQVLALVKAKGSNNVAIFKLPDGSIWTGAVILNSWEFSASAGEITTYSLGMQGSGDLTQAA